jgi:hypothetical protein
MVLMVVLLLLPLPPLLLRLLQTALVWLCLVCVA